MLLKNQLLKIKWNTSNYKWYIEKGYEFTKIRDEFYVKAEDLSCGSSTKVKVECDYCHDIYTTQYSIYYKSIKLYGKNSCCKCCGIQAQNKNLNKRMENRYKKALQICDDNGYVLLSEKDDFKNVRSGCVKYKCLLHGEKECNVGNFLSGHLCYECGRLSVGNKSRKHKYDVKKTIEQYNNNKLLNMGDYKEAHTPNLKIICGICGDVFYSSLSNYLRTNKLCPNCSNIRSNGENTIANILSNLDIRFIQQKKFEDCKDKRCLPFDFYLPDYNMCIEFQGLQHYECNDYFGGKDAYNTLIYHDNIKKEYCNKNNIKFLEIKYNEINNIEKILKNNLN